MLFFFIIIYNINLLGNKHCMIHIKEKKKKRKKKQTNKQTLFDASWLGRKTWATKAIHISSTKEENEGKEKKKLKK